VESKNWSMVRAYTGWRRYDTDEELEAIRQKAKEEVDEAVTFAEKAPEADAADLLTDVYA